MGHCLLNMCSHTQGGQVRLAVPHLRTAQTTKVSRGTQKNVAVKADMPHFGVRGTMGAVQPAGVAVRSAPQLFDVGGALDRRHVLQLLLARGTGILVYLARRLAHATGAPRILALAFRACRRTTSRFWLCNRRASHRSAGNALVADKGGGWCMGGVWSCLEVCSVWMVCESIPGRSRP